MSTALQDVPYEIRLDVPLQHDEDDFIWLHPRVTAVPAAHGGEPTVLMTLQKHLSVSDYYAGLHVMRTHDLGRTWTGPDLPAELDWYRESDEVMVSVCDVTPAWHAPTGRALGIGIKVRYGSCGRQLDDRPHSHESAYAVYDPSTNAWTPWRMVGLPDAETKFYTNGCGCSQFVIEPNGDVFVPTYFAARGQEAYRVTVVRCGFDGDALTYLDHGDELALGVERGLCEPSLIELAGRYYLTLRNDLRGYVTMSDNGLHFEPIRPWCFDDGEELGSYNTQQHWLTHGESLFLIYTRRGLDNDHVFRHRAPLAMAQVDCEKLCVIRRTERVLIPEHGVPMGNFGAARISERESWVTASEFMWPSFREMARTKGAAGRTFVARIIWAETSR